MFINVPNDSILEDQGINLEDRDILKLVQRYELIKAGDEGEIPDQFQQYTKEGVTLENTNLLEKI